MSEQEPKAGSEGIVGQSASTGGLERCLLFHKWGKWRDIARGDVKVDGNFRGWYIRQERRCNRCGKVQLRDATTL